MADGNGKVQKKYSEELLLAIDVGTQSLRAALFSPDGKMVDIERIIYNPPYISPQKGWAERDPRLYWKDLCTACNKLLSRNKREAVKAVCLTTQRATTVFLDKEYQPVRNAMLWLDIRTARQVPSLGLLKTAFTLVGAKQAVENFQRRSPVNWLIENEPDRWKDTEKVCFLSTYLNLLLTDRYADSWASQVGYLPFNFRKFCWEREGHWKYKAVPVEPNMLPELLPPGDIIGEVTERASSETGIPKGIPVISGASDKACEVLGSGGIFPHQACLGYGTTATVNINTPRYAEAFRFMPPYPSAIPGEYNVEYQVFRGFWLVTWFKEQFAKTEVERAQKLNRKPEELLEELASKVPPGSSGLILSPYWTPGVYHPGPYARGSIVGFTEEHKKEHIYRALIEGIIFALKEGLEAIEKKIKTPVKEAVVAGGGATSRLVSQCTADILNLPTLRPSNPETSALGAAMISAHSLKFYDSIRDAAISMAGPKEVFEPVPERSETYQKIYHNVFKKIIPALKDVYRNLDRID